MDSSTLDKSELSSIIRFGAEAIFASDENAVDSSEAQKFDDEAIAKLVDREAMLKEDLVANQDKPSAEDDPEEQQKSGSFSFAKVWTLDNEAEAVEETVEEVDVAKEDEEFWAKLLKDTEQASDSAQGEDLIILGKRRARARVNYSESSKRAKVALTSIDAPSDEDEDEYEPPTREDSPDSQPDIPLSPMEKTKNKPLESGYKPLPPPKKTDYISGYRTDNYHCWVCGPDSYYHPIMQCPMAHDNNFLSELLKRLQEYHPDHIDTSKIHVIKTLLTSRVKKSFVQIPLNQPSKTQIQKNAPFVLGFRTTTLVCVLISIRNLLPLFASSTSMSVPNISVQNLQKV